MVCPPLPAPWFLDAHSAAIQSVCAIVGLIVVICYTCFTWSIRQATVRQATAAQRPLLVLEWDETAEEESDGEGGPSNKTSAVYIENKGNGPALGVFWKIDQRNEVNGKDRPWHELGALAVGDWSDLPNDTEPELPIVPPEGVRLHYKDLAGNFYCTRVFHKAGTIQQDSIDLSKRECLHLH
jgi:hypothetical protein